ncbi:MAG TPA: FUSC family protein [Capillimicrobium sp.]
MGPALRDVVEEAFRVQERGVDWRSAIAGALAVAGPLLLGLAADDTAAGVSAALGGLNGALVVPRAGLAVRAGWAAAASLALLAAFTLATLTTEHVAALVAVTCGWVALWGFLRAAGPAGALDGFAISVVLVVVAGIPVSDTPFDERLAWFACGVAPGAALMVAARRHPERQVPTVATAMRAAGLAMRRDGALRAHVARLAVVVALCTLLERALDLPHGYWVPMTVLAVLQPGRRATRVRSVQRVVGTLAGASLIILVTVVTGEPWVLAVLAGLAAGGLFALDERGYFWLVVMLTPTALLVVSVARFQGDAIGVERVAESGLGILIGLAVGELVGWLAARRRPAVATAGA